MNLIYYRSKEGNFGDDLNPWLWSKIFGDFDQYDKEVDFIGIGSILDKRVETGKKKIVFGSGVRDILNIPEFSSNDDIRFVRGPVSSKLLNNARYITDSAYCLGLLQQKTIEKEYDLAFIPYFEHVDIFDWKLFEKITRIKVIIPSANIEEVINEVAKSRRVLAVAMHGAILADILRVPWKRVRFSQQGNEPLLTSEIKWFDWHKSMEIDFVPTENFGFTFLNKAGKMRDLFKIFFMNLRLNKYGFILSKEEVFKEKLKQLEEQVNHVVKNYKN